MSLLMSCVLFSAFSFWTIDRAVAGGLNIVDTASSAEVAYRHSWAVIISIWPIAAYSVRPYIAGLLAILGAAAILLTTYFDWGSRIEITVCLYVSTICLWTFSLAKLVDRFRAD